MKLTGAWGTWTGNAIFHKPDFSGDVQLGRFADEEPSQCYAEEQLNNRVVLLGVNHL